jgi:hypothetical protein
LFYCTNLVIPSEATVMMDTTIEIHGAHIALKSTSIAATIVIVPSILAFIFINPYQIFD